MGLNDEHEKMRQAKDWLLGNSSHYQMLAAGEFLTAKINEGVMHRLYIGNKMTEIPYFNAPWFDHAEASLRQIPTVLDSFNPAHHDREAGFDPMSCPHGSRAESTAAGFDLHAALKADWSWIADHSTGMIAGPDWMRSPGARSEVCCHHALGLPVWEYDVFLRNWDKPHLYQMVIPPMKPVLATLIVDGPEPGDDDGGLLCDCHG